MTSATVEFIELDQEELQSLLERAKATSSESDYRIIEAVVRSYSYLTNLIDDKQTTIRHLRALLTRKSSEKTSDVVGESSPPNTEATSQPGSTVGESEPSSPTGEKDSPSATEKPKRKGHGRNGAKDYPGAKRIHVEHQSLKPGDPCPNCQQGKVYERRDPAVIVRITGKAPLQATVYELQQLRCNFCHDMFTAAPPEGIGEEKYDASAGAMVALMRYGLGVPHNRLEPLQKTMGVPLPNSTQYEVVEDGASKLMPIYKAFVQQAAQGEVLHNDDTSTRILDHIKENKHKAKTDKSNNKKSKHRTGTFTSGIVSIVRGRTIALFFTGRRHAGENLSDLLKQRLAVLEAPIQMCDGSSSNTPDGLNVITANCLVHGRRHFVKIAESFPAECRYVLEQLGKVYEIDDKAKRDGLSAERRLHLHQRESTPIMEELEIWMNKQIQQKLVEPNSGLGEAINYMQKRWEQLTLFLRRSGAPLDTNVVERALKSAIRHRRNSLFYKTENGAKVGDLFMTLIHTCRHASVDPFDYLTQLLTHHKTASLDPERWMPWNYKESLAALSG